MDNLKNYINSLKVVKLDTNKDFTKLEQKQSRAIKQGIVEAFTKDLIAMGFDTYTSNKETLFGAVSDNIGEFLIGFDFVIKSLDYEIQPKA